MTVAITFFSKNEIILVSDQFRYLLKENVVKDTLAHKLEVTHKNFEECVQNIYRDAPKIFRFGKNTGIIAVGDSRFSSILATMNKRGNITKQILEQLKQKKLEGFWSCRIGRYNAKKEQTEMVSITYENGKVTITEHDRDTVGFDSFSLEMRETFFKKYAPIFYIGNTEEQIMVVKEFFDEISKLYNNKAGGQAVIAKIDKHGFKWIIKPKQSNFANFTTYAYNWCPEKIDTEMATTVSWSSDLNWTDDSNDPLHLEVTCDSKMLLFVNAYCRLSTYKDTSTLGKQIGSAFKLVVDTTDLPATEGHIANWADASSGYWVKGVYSCHTVVILEKGVHTIKLRVRMMGGTGVTAYFYERRLSALKGFYQGGTI